MISGDLRYLYICMHMYYHCNIYACDTACVTTEEATVTDQTDSTPAGGRGILTSLAEGAISMGASAQTVKNVINEENNSTLCVNTVRVVELNVDKHCE